MADSNQAAQAAKVALGTECTETFDVQSKVFPGLTGQITISIHDGRDLLKMGLIQHRLLEGVPLEELNAWTQATIQMLSTVAVVVRKAPDWWYEIVKEKDPKTGEEKVVSKTPAPEQVKDVDLLWEIHRRYTAFRGSFPRSGGDQNPGDSTA